MVAGRQGGADPGLRARRLSPRALSHRDGALGRDGGSGSGQRSRGVGHAHSPQPQREPRGVRRTERVLLPGDLCRRPHDDSGWLPTAGDFAFRGTGTHSHKTCSGGSGQPRELPSLRRRQTEGGPHWRGDDKMTRSRDDVQVGALLGVWVASRHCRRGDLTRAAADRPAPAPWDRRRGSRTPWRTSSSPYTTSYRLPSSGSGRTMSAV